MIACAGRRSALRERANQIGRLMMTKAQRMQDDYTRGRAHAGRLLVARKKGELSRVDLHKTMIDITHCSGKSEAYVSGFLDELEDEVV